MAPYPALSCIPCSSGLPALFLQPANSLDRPRAREPGGCLISSQISCFPSFPEILHQGESGSKGRGCHPWRGHRALPNLGHPRAGQGLLFLCHSWGN